MMNNIIIFNGQPFLGVMGFYTIYTVYDYYYYSMDCTIIKWKPLIYSFVFC